MTAASFTDTATSLAAHRGWATTPLKFLFRRSKRLGDGSEQLLSIYRDHGVIPKGSRSDNFNKASDDLSKYQKVDTGDLVVNKMKAWQGSVAISDHAGIISPAYFVYRPTITADMNARYLHYLLRSGLYFQHYGSISTGVRPNQWDLDPAAFERTLLLQPPTAEQHAIADYLDHETAEIDALMNDLETFDRLLVEHFSSFAERRIWQHKFPLCKAKYFCDTLSGFPFKSGEFQDPSPTNRRLLRGINVSPGTLTWADCVAIAEESAAGYREFEIAEGDLLLGLDRPLITDGLRVAPAKAEDAGSLLVQRVLRIRVDKAQTSTRWVQLALQGSKFKDFLIPSFSGVSVPHMSPGQVENFKIPLPSMSEQEEVLKQVDAEENVMLQTRSDIRSAIALARERRAALITAAVTGQIDVTARNKPAAEQLEDDIAQGLHREN